MRAAPSALRLRSGTSGQRASRNDDARVFSFQASSPACFSTALEDLAGKAYRNNDVRVFSFQASSPACFSTSLEDLAGRSIDNVNSLEDLAGRARLQDIVLMLNIQPSSPACFSTALEDLAGAGLAFLQHPDPLLRLLLDCARRPRGEKPQQRLFAKRRPCRRGGRHFAGP